MMVKVPAVTPAPGQGETDDRPNPAPRPSRMIPVAAMTKAPPVTAPQETAGRGPSTTATAAASGPRASTIVLSMPASSMPHEGEQNDDRYRYAKQPKQNPAAHDCLHFNQSKAKERVLRSFRERVG